LDGTIDADHARIARSSDDMREHEQQQRQVSVDVVERSPEDPLGLEPPTGEQQDRAQDGLCRREDLGNRQPRPVPVPRGPARQLRAEPPDPAEGEDGDDREPDDAMQGRHGRGYYGAS
jgi:hypothetical protein